MNPTADDDRFHPAPTPDPSWTETSWFAFMAPERSLAGTGPPQAASQEKCLAQIRHGLACSSANMLDHFFTALSTSQTE